MQVSKPPHILPLKVGTTVMSLCHLCNITRLVATEDREINFKTKLLSGTNNEEIVPEILPIFNEEDCVPFLLRRTVSGSSRILFDYQLGIWSDI